MGDSFARAWRVHPYAWLFFNLTLLFILIFFQNSKCYCKSPWGIKWHSVNAPATHQLTTHSSTCLYLLQSFQKTLRFPLFINPIFRFHSTTLRTTQHKKTSAFSLKLICWVFRDGRDEESYHLGSLCCFILTAAICFCCFHKLWGSENILLSSWPKYR